jgi:glutamine---fructose-6-phosphate transaminase (isomerizing)
VLGDPLERLTEACRFTMVKTMSHLEKEILSQPAVIGRLLSRERKRIVKIAKSVLRTEPRTVFVVARGSSDNAGLYGKYLFGSRNQLVTALATPSLFTLYRRPPNLAGCLVLALSQSGESDDLCQVVADGHRQGSRTLVITNSPRSRLAMLADDVIPLHAGKEKSVAATKSYTAQLMALGMLSAALGGREKDWKDLYGVPECAQKVLDNTQNISAAAERYRFMERLSVIGRGYNYATAFELSLKLKELAYLTAEPSSSADFRHGPIAVISEGFPVLLVAPKGKTIKDMKKLAGSLLARKAELLVISDDKQMLSRAHTGLPLAAGLPEWLSPLVSVMPGQLFAMHLAQARNCPLDEPRGLSKVTSTR